MNKEYFLFFFFQAEDGIRDLTVTGVQTCALPIFTPAALTVTADDKSRIYGSTNPELTGNVVGMVNGDNITAAFATSASTSSPVRPYAIVPSLIDPDGKLGNYAVTTNQGKLTITPAALTGTANNTSRLYGQPN